MDKRIFTPPEIKQKYTDLETKKLRYSDYRVYIYEFIDKMKANYPKSSLKNFYNNINNVKIKRDLQSILINASGHYEASINTIFISNSLLSKYTKETLFHELLHMASTIYKFGIVCSGFFQSSFIIKRIGEGINEGYTQLLTKRLCDKNEMNTYKEEVRIATNLEKIIGMDTMQDLYFNANLPGLIEEMSKYSSEEDAIRFIINVDYIHKHKKIINKDMYHSLLKNPVQKKYKDIYNLLLKMYIQKKIKEKTLPEEAFTNEVAKFIKDCGLDASLFSKVYVDDRIEILRNNLKELKTKEQILRKIR